MPEKPNKRQKYIIIIVAILAVLGLAAGGYFYNETNKAVKQNITELENKIIELENKNIVLADALIKEQKKNGEFSTQIGQIASTVGKLDQLSKTDKELLQKYSKVYFLNENYVPEDLINIPPDYIFEKSKEIKMHAKAFPYLQNMIVAAKSDGINLKIISAYRSFGEQSTLKNTYTVTYGSGANKFSADQGFSEHQLGTAIDFTTSELGLNFTAFKKSSAYEWLTQNSYKYGFILSYPDGNSYYQSEPWHWRFIGKALANMLYQESKNFYDIEQRAIDNYLIKIFD
jgi:LAS superfamily LD-carboxypeptidase LdcB